MESPQVEGEGAAIWVGRLCVARPLSMGPWRIFQGLANFRAANATSLTATWIASLLEDNYDIGRQIWTMANQDWMVGTIRARIHRTEIALVRTAEHAPLHEAHANVVVHACKSLARDYIAIGVDLGVMHATIQTPIIHWAEEWLQPGGKTTIAEGIRVDALLSLYGLTSQSMLQSMGFDPESQPPESSDSEIESEPERAESESSLDDMEPAEYLWQGYA